MKISKRTTFPPFGADGILVRLRDGGHDVVRSGPQEDGFGPAADQGVPSFAALALLLEGREADDAGPLDRDVGMKRLIGHPVVVYPRRRDRRPVSAGKRELQAVLSGRGVLARQFQLDGRFLLLGPGRFEGGPGFEIGCILEIEK